MTVSSVLEDSQEQLLRHSIWNSLSSYHMLHKVDCKGALFAIHPLQLYRVNCWPRYNDLCKHNRRALLFSKWNTYNIFHRGFDLFEATFLALLSRQAAISLLKGKLALFVQNYVFVCKQHSSVAIFDWHGGDSI